MFAKLLKHEWRSQLRFLGVLSLAALGLCIPGGLLLRLLTTSGEKLEQMGAVLVSMTMMLTFIFMALAVYLVAVQILLLVRFYKNKFTDEGYLTFTLPVDTHEILLSSYVNMLLWMFISMAVFALSVTLILVIGQAGTGSMGSGEWGMVRMVIGEMTEDIWGMYVQSAVALLCSPILTMSSLTIGAIWAQKHKVLAAVGVYYLISIISGMVTPFVSVFVLASLGDSNAAVNAYFVTEAFVQLGIAVGCYFLSVRLLRTKLNLP